LYGYLSVGLGSVSRLYMTLWRAVAVQQTMHPASWWSWTASLSLWCNNSSLWSPPTEKWWWKSPAMLWTMIDIGRSLQWPAAGSVLRWLIMDMLSTWQHWPVTDHSSRLTTPSGGLSDAIGRRWLAGNMQSSQWPTTKCSVIPPRPLLSLDCCNSFVYCCNPSYSRRC